MYLCTDSTQSYLYFLILPYHTILSLCPHTHTLHYNIVFHLNHIKVTYHTDLSFLLSGLLYGRRSLAVVTIKDHLFLVSFSYFHFLYLNPQQPTLTPPTTISKNPEPLTTHSRTGPQNVRLISRTDRLIIRS